MNIKYEHYISKGLKLFDSKHTHEIQIDFLSINILYKNDHMYIYRKIASPFPHRQRGSLPPCYVISGYAAC